MYFVYSLLLTLGFLVLLPRFILDALRHGKYVAGFRERLGILSSLEANGQRVIWLHCVSVGETQAARPLVREIRRRFPECAIVVSTITLTGQNLAREVFKTEAAKVFYFPFDWQWTVRRAFTKINPSIVLIMETELWPGFLRVSEKLGIPVAIVNGRLSERSFRRYKWIKGFVSRVLESPTLALMQTRADADRIHNLGLSSEKVFVSGNLKFDAGTMASSNSLIEEFRNRFDITNERPLILAASTHSPEEGIVVKAFQSATGTSAGKARLLLAPRHPERFAEAASLLKASNLSWTSRSAAVAASDRTCDVILLDTIGELHSLYSLASLVFVGGSIARTGGHNILEPAAVGAAIVTGAHTRNFEDIVKEFVKAAAVIQLPPLEKGEAAGELETVFRQLLTDPERRESLGAAAKALVSQNLGATDRTLEHLAPILNSTSRPTRKSVTSLSAKRA
jgi:3-deoxy-D-manno-octulosonic-acid transferase